MGQFLLYPDMFWWGVLLVHPYLQLNQCPWFEWNKYESWAGVFLIHFIIYLSKQGIKLGEKNPML